MNRVSSHYGAAGGAPGRFEIIDPLPALPAQAIRYRLNSGDTAENTARWKQQVKSRLEPIHSTTADQDWRQSYLLPEYGMFSFDSSHILCPSKGVHREPDHFHTIHLLSLHFPPNMA